MGCRRDGSQEGHLVCITAVFANQGIRTVSKLAVLYRLREPWRQHPVNKSLEQFANSTALSPQQRLEPPNIKLVDPGIATIQDMDTLWACVVYENTHQNRIQILRRLDQCATEIRADEG